MEKADDGFTLIEVIVALVLMSLAMAIVGNGLSNGRSADRKTQRAMAAMHVARSKIAEVGAIYPLQAGRWTGREVSGVAWTIAIDPYPAEVRGDAFRSYRVRVSAWAELDGGGEKVSLDTIRTTLAHGR